MMCLWSPSLVSDHSRSNDLCNCKLSALHVNQAADCPAVGDLQRLRSDPAKLWSTVASEEGAHGEVSHPAFNSFDPIFVCMKTVDLLRVQGDS